MFPFLGKWHETWSPTDFRVLFWGMLALRTWIYSSDDIYILTVINNLLPSKYLFPTSGKLVSTSWAISIITLCKINTFFHSGELHVFFSWEMTCDLVTNRFLELSYEECLLFPHESTAPMIYILTFKNNLQPSKYLFPTSGKLISTSWAISSITLYQITAFSTSGELLVTSSREITWDLVSNRFLELSYE